MKVIVTVHDDEGKTLSQHDLNMTPMMVRELELLQGAFAVKTGRTRSLAELFARMSIAGIDVSLAEYGKQRLTFVRKEIKRLVEGP